MQMLSLPEFPQEKPSYADVRQVLCHASDYFAAPAFLATLEVQVTETLSWMRWNKQSYSEKGELRENTPWWPAPPHTTSNILIRTRCDVLRHRAYEHGILHLVHGLVSKEALKPLTNKAIDELIDAMTSVVLRELVAKKYGAGNAPVSLSDLSKLFGNGDSTRPAKIRSRLARLSVLELVTGRENMGYAIRVGPVGDAFYTQIYTPIVMETLVNPETVQ